MKTLIVSVNSEITAVFHAALTKAGADDITVSDSGTVCGSDGIGYDFVILNLPLEGRFGLDEAAALAKKDDTFVLCAVPAKNVEKVLERIGNSTIMLVSKPFSVAALELTIRNIIRMKEKNLTVHGKLLEAETKISDIKLIERAKFVLSKTLSLTEAEAHRYIQKNAMDTRVKQVEVARGILKTYEM
ncbi:MAG: ANTAR domain-containing protein [Ruminococcus sp.]|jgi:response regulator NasT|nr:ANTAR domain-containing protein [Ruminococcus sp.]